MPYFTCGPPSRPALPCLRDSDIPVKFILPSLNRPLNLLCLGAHADDLEIGCGGTVLKLSTERAVTVRWLVFSARGDRMIEAQRSAESLLGGARHFEIEIHGFRDGFFPYEGSSIKETFEQVKGEFEPDLIFTHSRNDLHQDHRLLNELTWNTFRNHLVLEYEVPKYDGDLGSPNCFVELSPELVDRKIAHLMEFFPSQRDRRWYDAETFRGLIRLRGVEAGLRYAEAFYIRKAWL